MNIRKYNITDKEEVIKLFRLNTPKYFAVDEEADLQDYLDNGSQNYFVMESGQQLVGCGGFNFSEDASVGIIAWDFFHPDQQGKGLGSALVEFRIEKLRGYESVKIISVRTSQLAYKFYEKFGFQLKEIVKDYWAEGFDLYSMEFPVSEKEIKRSLRKQ